MLQRRRTVMTLMLAMALGCASGASAQSWPADSDWSVLRCGDGPSFDPVADEPGATEERDVVGDDAHPALYYFENAEHLFFRMRVDGDPTTGSELRPFGWSVEFNLDDASQDYELIVNVDGISKPEEVVLSRNTVQRMADDPADPPEVDIERYPATTYARGTQATGEWESAFDGDPDFFIDWAVKRATMEAEGWDPAGAFSLIMGTSSNATAINADTACHVGGGAAPTISGVETDIVDTGGEPPVADDADGDGLSADEEAMLGTGPDDADSDGDGYGDGTEVAAGTDPLDPQSHPMGTGSSGSGGGTSGGGSQGSGSSGDGSDAGSTDGSPEPLAGIRGGGGPAGCSVIGSGRPAPWWLPVGVAVGVAAIAARRRRRRRG